MQKSSVRRPFSWSRDGRSFTIGMLFGAVLAVAGSALAEDSDRKVQFVQAVLRAVAELAIDTERNAISIAELRQRIDDLELSLAEIGEEKN